MSFLTGGMIPLAEGNCSLATKFQQVDLGGEALPCIDEPVNLC